MPIYSKSIDDKLPSLYHYTSQIGMMSMAQYGKLWLTNLMYMNDAAEYTFFWKVLKKKLEELYHIHISVSSTASTLGLRASCYGTSAGTDIGSHYDIVPVFSFSLSERKDSLSQWRGYCPNGGYAISFYREGEFKDSQLAKMISDNSFHIGKCIYGETAFGDLLQNEIADIEPEKFIDYMSGRKLGTTDYIPSRGQYETLQDFLHKVIEKSLAYAPFLKDEAFEDEQEWRIVASGDNQFYNPSMKFREGKSFIVPYLEVPLLSKEDNELSLPVQIDEIVVGPTPHMDLAVKSCQLFRKDAQTKITPSSIPYRNW